jgi:hypothetical protein
MLTTKRYKRHVRVYQKQILAIFRLEKKYRSVDRAELERQGIPTTAIDELIKNLEQYRKIDPIGYNRIKKQVDKESLEEFSKEYYGT